LLFSFCGGMAQQRLCLERQLLIQGNLSFSTTRETDQKKIKKIATLALVAKVADRHYERPLLENTQITICLLLLLLLQCV